MLGAKQFLTDRNHAFKERLSLRIRSSAIEITRRSLQKIGAFRTRSGVGGFSVANRQQVRRQQRAAWPRIWVIKAVGGIDERQRPYERTPQMILRLAVAACRRNLPYEAMEADDVV